MTKQLERDAGGIKEGWPAIILYITLASALSGGLVYLATAPAPPVAVRPNAVVHPVAPPKTVTPPPAVTPAAVDDSPVRFANPFDPGEIFEFPSGTSETEAQQAVAEVLLQRAHEREKSWSKITYRHRTTAGEIPRVRTAGLSRRS